MAKTNEQLRAEWKERVSAFRASGQTAKDWAKANGVKLNRLRYWCRKYKEDAPSKETKWSPVEVDYSDESNITVKVGKASIEVKPGYDKSLLKDLVNTLSGLC
ncbi:IS66 family insertion sequence element accessory protein TnpA [Natranaerofaba carboxydovora]|uniref:IS66 family insertion sequence element accessory protein TnpA n=1 Tax=Natranaerofaba carboxydovora TaxID=2742683 RepID=UPI001F12A6BD|nr:hypothetical protein [Natranaerofaba carboxydovora]UMZ72530.1 hypothetical protein ACONDI_00050 [Natranaerofaba carboxydovora]UMZ73038.1 hypothetical protein ACONDI_00584 [Natranaerofaba carboxydovora]UMZ73109.1 hypothetical protein ACONDI_00660 [Natranaerofaba carboxydovora]UMZ73730.1 hypothetical protein ACONDI_01296 [Natranaerofaba carboxydovora]UMZ74389.1 hypothetical protein ACONDI_01977 [Natranaerofaba carboxydovora]